MVTGLRISFGCGPLYSPKGQITWLLLSKVTYLKRRSHMSSNPSRQIHWSGLVIIHYTQGMGLMWPHHYYKETLWRHTCDLKKGFRSPALQLPRPRNAFLGDSNYRILPMLQHQKYSPAFKKATEATADLGLGDIQYRNKIQLQRGNHISNVKPCWRDETYRPTFEFHTTFWQPQLPNWNNLWVRVCQ